MQYKWKALLSIICFATGLLLVTYLPALLAPAPKNNDQTSSESSGVTLTVNYGNGTVRTWTNINLTAPNNSAFNATVQKCVVDYKDYGNGDYFVTTIDGLFSNFWQYWVNGTYASVASTKLIVLNGSTIIWNCTH